MPECLDYITAFQKNQYLSEIEETETQEPEIQEEFEEPSVEAGVDDAEVEENAGLTKAMDTYRKLIEKEELTDKQKEELENRLKEIEQREIIEKAEEHVPEEIPCEKGKVTIGPPTLTRFEKARIMGARALQLSLGAPPFIPIPESARTSLDIAMEELEQRVIPIIIRRVLPNGDFQNIPIDYFDK